MNQSGTERSSILDFDREELAVELRERFSMSSYRARQILPWVYRQRETHFSAMTNITKEAREALASHYQITRPRLLTSQVSKDGTRKFLFELKDGAQIETVLIAQPTRYTLCVSSQVGCAIGCSFCRTALMGLKRNLKTSEILGQVLAVKDELVEKNLPDFTNMVFMGMGEPLHNIENVIRALRLLTDELGVNLAPRKITVSTSGLVPAIKKLGESGANCNLAISLNATTDKVRTELIPINKRYPIGTLLDSLREYPLGKRKTFTIEYVMLRGVNDTEEDLKRLPRLLRGIPSKVNLIPYNENSGLGFRMPSQKTITHWHKTLIEKGVNCTIRWSKGLDIDAACGQLAVNKKEAA